MMRVQVWYLAGLLFTAAAARAEYLRSAGEGAMQTGARGGVRDEPGYRLVGWAGLSRDVFGGRRWAEVRSGKHPERAAALVALEDRSSAEAYPAQEDAGMKTEPRQVLVAAGSRVTVVSAEATVPMEMMGVAVESGAAGERVRVRVVTEGQEGERMAWGVVLTAETVEISGQWTVGSGQ